jgi:hypothetical protein
LSLQRRVLPVALGQLRVELLKYLCRMANRNSGKMRHSNGPQEIEDVGLKQRVTLKIRPSLLLSRSFLGCQFVMTGSGVRIPLAAPLETNKKILLGAQN